MTFDIRVVEDGELDRFRDAVYTTFGDDSEVDPESSARIRALVPPAQRWAAYDGNTIVGTAGTIDAAIGLPGGGSIAMAGLTMVTVRPTHRRRGVMTALVERHLADARDRGFAISGLWASEAAIYGRFGYGLAAESDAIEIADGRRLELADDRVLADITFDWLEVEQARSQLPTIYERATIGRPGVIRRSPTWWQQRRFSEAPFARAGASLRRHVVARRGGDAVGYVAFRHRGKFRPEQPDGRVEIIELLAIDGAAELALWHFMLRIDLFPRVTWWNAPTDDPLVWSVNDRRAIQRRRTDTLWLRVADPAAALTARRYACDGAVRLAVDGVGWQVTVQGGAASCAATEQSPELELAQHELAGLVLGGVSCQTLARAGRVRGTAAAVARADQMFNCSIAPWCGEVF